MANEAVFQEVLQISVDTDKFAQDIQKVQQIYADALKNMPNIGGVGAASLSASLAELNKTITQISTGGTQVIKDLGTVMVDTASSVQASMSAMSQSVSQALSQVNSQLSQFKQQGGGGNRNSGGFGGIFANFGQTLANATKYLLAYKAVNEAITLTGDVISAPFKAIKEGFEYLQNFEERSSELKAVLLQTEEFSKNQADNFRIAGDEADRLTRNIDSMAIKLHTSSQTIQMALSAFLGYGGRNLVNSNDEALQVAGISTAALQSINPRMQSRQVISEIQKLVQGTLTDSNKLPAAFGLSAVQLNEMAKHAQSAKDLLAEILGHAQGLTERLNDAGTRQLALIASVDLLKQRWEGLVAGPLFKEYTKFLQDLVSWTDQHQGQLQDLGKTLGEILDKFYLSIKHLFEADWEGFVAVFKNIAELVLRTAEAFNTIISGISNTISLVELVKVRQFGYEGKKEDQAAVDKFKAEHTSSLDGESMTAADRATLAKMQSDIAAKQIEAEGQQYKNISVTDQMRKDINAALEGLNTGLQGIDFSKLRNSVLSPEKENPNTPTTSIHPKASGSDRSSLMAQFRERLAETKAEYEEEQRAIEEGEALKTKTVADAEEERLASMRNELLEAMKIAREYYSKINNDPNLKPEQKLQMKAQITQQMQALDKQYQDSVINADRKTKQEEDAIENAKLDGDRQRQQQHLQAVLQTYRTELANHQITNEQMAQAEVAAQQTSYENEINDLNRKMAKYAEGTAEKTKLEEQLATLKQKQFDQEDENIEKLRQARLRDYQEQIKNEEEILSLKASAAGFHSLGASRLTVLGANVAGAQANVGLQNAKFKDSLDQLVDALRNGETPQEIQRLRNQLEQNRQAVIKATDQLKAAQEAKPSSLAQYAGGLQQILFGSDDTFQQVFGGKGTAGQGNGIFDRLDAAAEGLTNVFGKLGGEINQKKQAFDQGGVLGGIGSIMSQGMTGQLLGMIPVAGPIINAVGAAFSFFGDLFTQKARDIADKINKQIQAIDQQYQLGQITLADAISQLNAQKQNAIQQLSGVKGGSKELNMLLPQLDQQIQQLQKQAKDTMDAFEQQLSILQLHGSELENWANSWENINKQVKTYLDAGGDLNKANQFLQENLNNLRQGLQDNLNSGEQNAIQDALQLNQLIKQRIDLQKQEAQTEFGLMTQDSIERRGNTAITIAQQLQTARQNFNQQMSDLNNQITLTQQKVAAESKIYDINKSIADLQAESNALTIASLNEQIDKYQQMKQLLASTNGMTFNGPFNNNYTPGISPISSPTHVFQINVNGGNGSPQDIGDSVANAIAGKLREFSPV